MFEWEIVIWFHVIVSIFSRSACSTYSNFLNRPIQFFFPAQLVRPLCLLPHSALWFHSALFNFFFLLSLFDLFLMNSKHGKQPLFGTLIIESKRSRCSESKRSRCSNSLCSDRFGRSVYQTLWWIVFIH